MINSCCFIHLNKNESIMALGTATPSVLAYNKISNTSKTCIDKNGKTKYETICDGIPERKCDPLRTKNKFVPNGCVSDGYNYGVTIKGDKYGSCECNPEIGQYNTLEECKKQGSSCHKVKQSNAYYALNLTCYTTCESLGYYSTEAACKQGLPSGYRCLTPGAAQGNSNCYVRKKYGFTIMYSSNLKRSFRCSSSQGGASQTASAWAYLQDIKTNGYPTTVDGHQYGELSTSGVNYPAGTYRVCSSRSNTYIGITRTSIQTQDHGTSMCFADVTTSGGGMGCEPTETYGSLISCHSYTFEDGRTYYISMTYDTSTSVSGVSYTCN